jgi:hypothetical protein
MISKIYFFQIYGWHPKPYKNSTDLPEHAPASLRKYVQVFFVRFFNWILELYLFVFDLTVNRFTKLIH